MKPRDITDIPQVDSDYYENILSMYQTQDESSYYYFNISKKIVIDMKNIDESNIEYYYLGAAMPLTTVSYRLFGTQHLWWLIATMNKLNPLDVPQAGTVIAVPTNDYLINILQTTNQ